MRQLREMELGAPAIKPQADLVAPVLVDTADQGGPHQKGQQYLRLTPINVHDFSSATTSLKNGEKQPPL